MGGYGVIETEKLLTLMQSLSNFGDEMLVKIDNNGWYIAQVDPAHVQMVEVILDPSDFQEYAFTPKDIGVEPDKIIEFLKALNVPRAIKPKTVKVEIDDDGGKMTIVAVVDGTLTRKSSLVDPKGLTQPKLPDLPHDVSIPITEAMAKEMNKNWPTRAEGLILDANMPSTFTVSWIDTESRCIKQSIFTTNMTFIKNEEPLKSRVTAMYPAQYMQKIIKLIRTGLLEFRDENPMFLNYFGMGFTKMLVLCAPRLMQEGGSVAQLRVIVDGGVEKVPAGERKSELVYRGVGKTWQKAISKRPIPLSDFLHIIIEWTKDGNNPDELINNAEQVLIEAEYDPGDNIIKGTEIEKATAPVSWEALNNEFVKGMAQYSRVIDADDMEVLQAILKAKNITVPDKPPAPPVTPAEEVKQVQKQGKTVEEVEEEVEAETPEYPNTVKLLSSKAPNNSMTALDQVLATLNLDLAHKGSLRELADTLAHLKTKLEAEAWMENYLGKEFSIQGTKWKVWWTIKNGLTFDTLHWTQTISPPDVALRIVELWTAQKPVTTAPPPVPRAPAKPPVALPPPVPVPVAKPVPVEPVVAKVEIPNEAYLIGLYNELDGKLTNMVLAQQITKAEYERVSGGVQRKLWDIGKALKRGEIGPHQAYESILSNIITLEKELEDRMGLTVSGPGKIPLPEVSWPNIKLFRGHIKVATTEVLAQALKTGALGPNTLQPWQINQINEELEERKLKTIPLKGVEPAEVQIPIGVTPEQMAVARDIIRNLPQPTLRTILQTGQFMGSQMQPWVRQLIEEEIKAETKPEPGVTSEQKVKFKENMRKLDKTFLLELREDITTAKWEKALIEEVLKEKGYAISRVEGPHGKEYNKILVEISLAKDMKELDRIKDKIIRGLAGYNDLTEKDKMDLLLQLDQKIAGVGFKVVERKKEGATEEIRASRTGQAPRFGRKGMAGEPYIVTVPCAECGDLFTNLDEDTLYQLDKLLGFGIDWFRLCDRCKAERGRGNLIYELELASRPQMTVYNVNAKNYFRKLIQMLQEAQTEEVQQKQVGPEEAGEIADWMWHKYRKEIVTHGFLDTWGTHIDEIEEKWGHEVAKSSSTSRYLASVLRNRLYRATLVGWKTRNAPAEYLWNEMGMDLMRGGLRRLWDKQKYVFKNLYQREPEYEEVISDLLSVVPDDRKGG